MCDADIKVRQLEETLKSCNATYYQMSNNMWRANNMLRNSLSILKDHALAPELCSQIEAWLRLYKEEGEVT